MEHDHLIAMLNRLKLTAIRDQLDSLIDEAGRRELTIREALSLFCEREIANFSGASSFLPASDSSDDGVISDSVGDARLAASSMRASALPSAFASSS